MLECLLLLAVLNWLSKIVVGYREEVQPAEEKPRWQFESLDDAMEYAELRRGGWKGDIDDYYSEMKGW